VPLDPVLEVEVVLELIPKNVVVNGRGYQRRVPVRLTLEAGDCHKTSERRRRSTYIEA